MRYQRLFFTLIAACALTSPARAASVTMLQFGSYETRAEAEAKLAEVKNKHASVIGKLPSSIREVKLPPDNVVYRTQAGPLPDKAAAQSICAQLATNGDECFVVQTAMMPGADSAVISAVAPETKPALVAPPSAPAVVAKAAEAVALPPMPSVAVAAAPNVSPSMPSLEPATSQAIPLIPSRSLSLSSAAPSFSGAAPASSSVKPQLIAPLSAAVTSAGSTAPLAGASPAPFSDFTPAEPSPQLKAALERAAAANGEPSLLATIPQSEVAEASPSFWSRLNPFRGAQPEAAAVATASPVVVAAAALPEAKKELPPLPPPPENIPPELIEKAMALPAPMPAPATAANVTVAPIETKQVPATQLAMPAPMPAPAPEPLATPVSVTPLETNIITKAEPLRLPPPPPPLYADRAASPAPQSSSVPANVKVEEAKRVPLSEATIIPAPPQVASVPGPAPTAPALSPAATLGTKTLWGQIGQFADTQAALAFWDAYRQRYPDFPAVRVRVTTPYQARLRGDERVWLRVGPFQRDGFVKNLCSTLPENSELRCGAVQDMGYAGSPTRVPGLLPGSRYAR